jgi:RNA polymerase sigma factor (TIGR02999 family)
MYATRTTGCFGRACRVIFGDMPSLDDLLPKVYDELRELARRRLRDEQAGHTLNTTALVHEAYLRLSSLDDGQWRDRAQFFALASTVMRHVLVDYARRRSAEKRGGSRSAVTLDPDRLAIEPRLPEFLAVNDALDQLAVLDPRLVQVVECRFFGGLTARETAEALGTSLRTVERDWMRARAYLQELLADESGVIG